MKQVTLPKDGFPAAFSYRGIENPYRLDELRTNPNPRLAKLALKRAAKKNRMTIAFLNSGEPITKPMYIHRDMHLMTAKIVMPNGRHVVGRLNLEKGMPGLVIKGKKSELKFSFQEIRVVGKRQMECGGWQPVMQLSDSWDD